MCNISEMRQRLQRLWIVEWELQGGKGPCCCVHMNLQVTLMLKDMHVPWDPKHTKHEISKDQCFKKMHLIASYHESQMVHG